MSQEPKTIMKTPYLEVGHETQEYDLTNLTIPKLRKIKINLDLAAFLSKLDLERFLRQ